MSDTQDPEQAGPATPGAPDPAAIADAPAVEFVSQLTPITLTQVLTAGTLSNPSVLTVLLAGPTLLLVAALTNSRLLLQWGTSFLITIPAVPLISFAIGYFNALRKSAKPLYQPLTVRADGEGLTLIVGEETRQAGWEDFSRWRRVFGCHLLYNSLRTFIVLRTDALDTDARTAFEGLLRTHVPNGPRR